MWSSTHLAREANRDALVLSPDVEERDAPAWELSVDGQPLDDAVILSGKALGGPLLVGTEWAGCLWLAHDRTIHAFPENLKDVRSRTLDAPVYEVRLLPAQRILVVVHEIGVVALADDVTIRWSVSTDIITDIDWRRRNALIIQQMDGPALRIDLLTGRAETDQAQ
ncbi:hypothetical protein [Cryptosporangium sp. NPDC051539]|uniref:hypothetical protein n=1 Tax=Cryptosporangium sp. NPDC051539 TaxID=3363962 RepID=UPI00378B47D5